MLKYKVAVLLPYFGKFPSYFQLWLNSASKNIIFTFFIFTNDDTKKYVIPSNVVVIKMTLQEVRSRIKSILPYRFNLPNAYMICEFRPLFGLIFKDYLIGYDFWGHCDADVIWGNLSKYITEDVLDEYDKIYTKGHLSLFRNTEHVNNIPLKDLSTSYVKCRHIFSSNYYTYYDEGPFLREKMKVGGCKIYDQSDCADVYYTHKNFILYKGPKICYFCYKDGQVLGYDENNNEIGEFAYLHLQKRKMEERLSSYSNQYAIIPNSFIEIRDMHNNISIYAQRDFYFELHQLRLLLIRKLRNAEKGALKFKALHLMSKLFLYNKKKYLI